MKYIFAAIIFALFATGLTSCESDNPSGSGSTTKELEVTPSKTSVGIYETFTIKARMTNTPLSDVRMKIDFGDGMTEVIGAGSERAHSYTIVGTYTLTVKAIDEYTRDTLATKSIQIIVSDVIPVVAFDRDLIDTTVLTRDDGRLEHIYFSFTTNAFLSKVRYQFGDGSIYADSVSIRSYTTHFYESPGTYKVIVDVYNDKGNYWASDTMMVTIRLPEVTLDMLTSAYNVSVALAVDSTSPIFKTVKSYDNIKAAIGTAGDSVKKVAWNGNSFNAYSITGNIGNIQECSFIGTISDDMKKLETMSVSAYDSTHSGPAAKWGYTLSNLELCGVNNEVVIYRAIYRPLSTFATNEYVLGQTSSRMREFGPTSEMLQRCVMYSQPLPPYAYVVFTRK